MTTAAERPAVAAGLPALPPACEAGSRVGIVAPSGPVKPKLLYEGLRILREWGLVPVLYRSACVDDDDAAPASKPELGPDDSVGSVGEDVPFLEGRSGGGGASHDSAGTVGFAATASLASAEVSGFLSASDSVRAAELQAALADQSTRAVLCARGGYGAARLLPLVDWAAAAAGARDKRFLGFSDATVLHSALHAAAAAGGSTTTEEEEEGTQGRKGTGGAHAGGLVTFHAPMLATGKTFVQLPESDLARYRAALFAPALDENLFPPLPGQRLYGATRPSERPGQAEMGVMGGGGSGRAVGVLFGGNLTTLASMCGGGWAACFGVATGDLDLPYILALEDENETAVRIDRHCRQLRMAGLLGDHGGGGKHHGGRVLAGLVLGRFDKDDVLLPSGVLGAPPPSKAKGGTASLCCAKRTYTTPPTHLLLLLLCPTFTRFSARRSSLRVLTLAACCCPVITETWGKDYAADRRGEKGRYGRYIDNVDGVEPQAFFWRRVVELVRA
jgi:muramoyltetrapeptide carboxypeptidase LdcA involved in peptidoglycan recycling